MRDGTLERRRALLHDAIALIVTNHGPSIDLDSVARAIGTSRRQLQRVFNELSDRSFRDTLAAVRMGHARTLLATTNRPIGQIAREVGYADPAQFTKAFRHHHAMAPRQYRRDRRALDGASAD
jgi:transcriptional regulator GlxA family with amidase domain